MRLGEGKEPEEGPKEEDPRPPRPKAIGHEEDEEGEEVDPAPGGEDAARGLHQGVAQKPPGEGEFSLLREPLQENPPPRRMGALGVRAKRRPKERALTRTRGRKGTAPQGPKFWAKLCGSQTRWSPQNPRPAQNPSRKPP